MPKNQILLPFKHMNAKYLIETDRYVVYDEASALSSDHAILNLERRRVYVEGQTRRQAFRRR